MGRRLLVFNRADVESFEKPKKTGRPRKEPKPGAIKPGRPKKPEAKEPAGSEKRRGKAAETKPGSKGKQKKS